MAVTLLVPVAQAKEPAPVASSPTINFHENFVKSIVGSRQKDDGFDAMADILFQSLPDKMTIFPSEGYYYFQFYSNGNNVRGNIRFDARFIKEGKLPVLFYNLETSGEENNERYRVLENSPHFRIKPVGALTYEILYKGRAITASLYDLQGDKASFKSLQSGEIYIGPLLDDSAVKFDLIYHNEANVFLYLLNERDPAPETFRKLQGVENVLIGNRTGFAYFVEPNGRKILAGAVRKDVEENSHYDGPFDQLPDTIMDPDQIKTLLERYAPDIKGKILPGGWYKDDSASRYAIFPYMLYSSESELFRVSSCGLSASTALRYACLGHLRKD